MNELPLSKFAPFEKYESGFQPEVMNKLKELNIQCKGCIYFDESKKIINTKDSNSEVRSSLQYDYKEGEELYHCHIFHDNEYVAPYSICRFFTPQEDVEDKEEEELSVAIQKLDFANSNIIDNINKLRDSILND